MTSIMKKPARDLTMAIATRPNDTLSSTTAEIEDSLHECCLNDILEKDAVYNGTISHDTSCLTQQTLPNHQNPSNTEPTEPKSPPRRAMSAKRPLLQKKSYSDLACYNNVHMKILVEGEEVLDTCLKGNYCSRGSLSSSPQDTSSDADRVMESLQREQDDTKKPAKFFTGWLTKKTQSKSQNDKNSEPPIGFRSLRRSRSFSGRIKDKIKSISPSNTNRTVGQKNSRYLQTPMFYKIIDLKNVNREDHAFRANYQRRHSDQTDSMPLSRPLSPSSKYCTMSLERGLKQHTASDKKLLERKKSNSLEKLFEFPFWSQITDADRSLSCNGRIRVSETHGATSGMLETNLCSTEL